MKHLAFAALSLLCLSSCASRKKEVHETKSNFRFKSEVDSAFTFRKDLTFNVDNTKQQQTEFSNWSVDYDGQNGDSISITETGPDGRTTQTTIRGKGKATMSKGSSRATAATKEKATLKEATQFEASAKTSVSAGAETKNKDKEVQNTGFQALWIVLIIIILVARWFFNRRIDAL